LIFDALPEPRVRASDFSGFLASEITTEGRFGWASRIFPPTPGRGDDRACSTADQPEILQIELGHANRGAVLRAGNPATGGKVGNRQVVPGGAFARAAVPRSGRYRCAGLPQPGKAAPRLALVVESSGATSATRQTWVWRRDADRWPVNKKSDLGKQPRLKRERRVGYCRVSAAPS